MQIPKWVLILAGGTGLCTAAFLMLSRSSEPLVSAQEYGGERVWLRGHAGRLKALVFSSEDAQHNPRLIMVLHGDSPFSRPRYQYRFARNAARTLSNVVVAAILRPGYADPTGDRSDGQRGLTTGDNYTSDVIDDVAAAATQLQTQFHTLGVTLVGHSGGAAISADVMERHADLASRALLISCPCDLGAWRAHMDSVQHNPIWRMPISSLSPIDGVSQLSHNATLLMMVGGNDDVAPPQITYAFAAAARPHVGSLEVMVVPNAPHDILLDPATMALLQRLESEAQ